MSHKKRRTLDAGVVCEDTLTYYSQFAEVDAMEAFLHRSLEASEERHLETLDAMEQMRVRWSNAEDCCHQQSEELKRLNQKLELEKTHSASLEVQLKQAKATIASLSAEKQIMEVELAAMKRKFDLGRDLLMDNDEPKPSSSSHYRSRSSKKSSQRFNDASIDFDVTGDSLDDVVPELPSIKNKRSRGAIVEAAHEVEQDENDMTPIKRSRDNPVIPQSMLISKESPKKAPIRRSMNRSFSESNLLDSKEIAKREVFADLNGRCAKTPSSNDLRSPNPHMVGFGASWTRGYPIERLQHRFKERKTGIINSCYCDVCNTKFAMRGVAYKCIDCNMNIHTKCKDRAPEPCVPRNISTPKTPSKQRPKLKDFCPSSRPMIPYVMIHCIVALERNRLNSEGIYRIPGNDARVNKLLGDLKKGSPIPKLDLEDTETITSCIKKFLRDLNDSLVPMTSFREFEKAVESHNKTMLTNAIHELPITNRDTLAYLCLHLQKVASNSQINKMPLENLTRCIAPSVVGETHLARSANTMTHSQMTGEMEKRINIMMELLSMPSEYWRQIIDTTYGAMAQAAPTPNSASNVGSHASSARRQLLPRSPGTPLSATAQSVRTAIDYTADHSMLGPIRTPPTGSSVNLIQPVSRRAKPLFDKP
ncbi:hypothetical protein QR680_013954 [Steinernema hermaphroditum]|uniref:Rho-GAP domain-containing protein n=1 Tax=Steinernema hermaphroditum TaxID=289476 RepID=A0AA39M337_9BILA|nr:hypothetical protein QR680_013954 [Steinernema hermaphroditum]